MGSYLSTPILDKHTEVGCDLSDTQTPIRWAVVDMQGWRKTMEDAHVARTDVMLPGGRVDDGGGGGGGGIVNNAGHQNNIHPGASAAASQHAKVFAVFDGHGGAEVARFCSIYLVPMLISRSHWRGATAAAAAGGGADNNSTMNGHDNNNSMAACNNTDQIDTEKKEEEEEDEENSADAVSEAGPMNMNGSGNNNNISSNSAAEASNARSDNNNIVIPTKSQLLNPPTGIVPVSASVPTRIQNGRKICNLPDHPVHAGCTSVVSVIVGRTLVVANAGDSRAVICRAGGVAEPLSFDHKPFQNREMDRITNAGGFVNQFGRVNGNLNLSRSIGDLKYKQVPGIPPAEQMITAEPDILSTTLWPGDEFIVLGCDGIWDCLSNEECVKYVRDRIDSKVPHEIGREMLDEIVSADPRASQGIGGDNMTIIIVDLLPHTRSYSKGNDC
ncbi:hypothetical protein ACHAXH_005569 [Discostella pseudostelligera]